jgi:predicted nucleic acid-binding protein
MIVVDTNVIAYFWLPGEYTTFAERALNKDNEWAAPILWRSEFRNILAGYIRRKNLTIDMAVQLMEHAEAQMKGREYIVETGRILNLVNISLCSAYDCEFVALAEDLVVPLITTDKKVIRTFPSIVIPLDKFIK